MESFAYKDIQNQEKNHWWFKARREIIREKLNKLNIKKDSTILEIGCGTGGNIPMLKKYGKVYAIEMDDYAIEISSKHNIQIKKASFPIENPFENKFDLICMFDVLEHIENDIVALEQIKKMLTKDGILIITVPAYTWLYSTHDKFLHHKRRYTLSKIESLVKNKFEIYEKTYFNTLLFPAIVIARFIDKIYPKENSLGYKTPNKIVNFILFQIFRFEKYLLRLISFKFGSSIFASFKNKSS
ncbi:class I SAM-dependent methyltransferase [Arcobacter arenosus]|uniref:Class I SAM-dependent methyltransferase n=1 Tax=Arcobacter arenosus TaxID=2576037 RepID=A0A5R8Y2V6_9BACT|nr:class I SAM-dependent methyltransferase [Arcobacter arenosus]TLP39622.1 class I SAM-dependent methyltransferase [Arcobacter arenosus]